MNRGFSNGSTTPGLNGSTASASDANQTNSTNTTPMKACRYGINCSRVDCHFTHPDRRSPSSLAGATTSSQPTAPPSTPNNSGRSNTWFPLQFNMGIEEDTNELKIDLKSFVENETTNHSTACTAPSNTLDTTAVPDNHEEAIGCTTDDDGEGDTSKERKISENTVSSTSSHSSSTANCSRKSYKLTAVVCQINNASQKNLISLIYVGSRYHEMHLGDQDPKSGQWYIFNDFRYVCTVHLHDFFLAIYVYNNIINQKNL